MKYAVCDGAVVVALFLYATDVDSFCDKMLRDFPQSAWHKLVVEEVIV